MAGSPWRAKKVLKNLLMVKTFVLPIEMQLLGITKEHKFIYFANIIYIETISPPYTFFLLNGDMEFYRDRHLFIQKVF